MRNKSGSEPAPSWELLTVAEAKSLASAVHGSLYLDAILRGCRRALASRFRIGRVSLVQHRATEFTATLYSLDSDGDAPLLGPYVIALEDSRLRECLIEQERIVMTLGDPSLQDNLEKKFLLRSSAGVVYLPLCLEEKFKGVLVVAFPDGTVAFGPDEEAYLSYLADQLALAIENSDIFYLERRQSRALTMVSEIAKQAVLLEDLDEFLSHAAVFLREGFNYHAVEIWNVSPKQERLMLRARAYKDDPPPERPNPELAPPMVEDCRRENRVLCCNNLTAEPHPSPERSGTLSQLTVPIRLRGKFLAVLSLESRRLDAFAGRDETIMEGVASLIASAYDNLRVFEHAQQSNEYLQAILDSARDLAILSTDIHGYVITASAGAQQVFHMTSQEVLGKDILTLFAAPRFQREIALYMANKEQLAVLERSRVPQGTGQHESYVDVTLQRVFDAEGHAIGFLCVARDVTENVRLQKRLEALSITDELTTLFNQRHFFAALSAEIDRSRRFRKHFSLVFFDLDGFKKFNDSLGHLRGDQVLEETARMILGLVRANVDACFRYGGDEFTVIMPETTIENAETVAGRIRVQLCEHFEGQITASIGIAEFSEPLDARAMVEKADKAMYGAKERGGNCIVRAD